ncbi:MAG: FG-GAP repeat protein [Gomphosphaeria aponina SAG 52.96 = DSM 107014]|uniref:FG-GAP repeat protein n=1 Tax=Gomphosphaeria aponina SAG 52.96 = DSM 107014 TaxID=1521640 RepID=A0A941JRE4_9CHRO|nr:FG-GAP repeat protein [Gomphosphaeria aponina SAG 52.96 = DSM 107014]
MKKSSESGTLKEIIPSSFDPVVELSELDGTDGFKINGEAAGDESGQSVSSAGDINGDNIDDIVVGARFASPNGKSGSGRSYVVFGTEEWEGELNLEELDGTNGFKINGEAAGDLSGYSVSSAGDINGDDIDDIVVGAPSADFNGYNETGRSYVVFGNEDWEGELNLEDLDGTNGVKINGRFSDFSGASVSSAGDNNGDDIDDIVVGAPRADSRSGRSYVVFGNEEWEGELNLEDLDGTNGVKINGEVAFDFSGASVSSAGDINGDNIDDIVIGAVGADPRGNDSGRSYVVFGTDGEWEGELNLEELDGTNGFKINGEAAGDRAGFSVSSAGDINGDDIKDIVVGTRDADPNGERSGRSYVIFGKAGIEIIPNKQKVVEGLNNQAVVRVKVEKVTEKVTIEYRTEDGTARAGLDYREKTGKLTFSPGETSKKITIPIVNNNQNEAEESFTFILENPSNKAFSGEKSAVINISDTQTAAKTTTLRAGVENLLLTGRGNINGTGNNNNNILTGNSGNNTLGGKAGNDQLNGKAGNDLLNGGAGADTMSGGKGNDSFKVENAKDVVKEEGNSGTDTVFSLITRKLGSNQENLILEGTLPINGTGNSLANVITGNGKENNLTGLGGNDQLVGKAGKDILTGGTGKDILTGGTGGDRFNYNFPSEGIDTITDFKKAEGDKIYISATGFKGGLGAGPLPSDKFVVGSAALDSGDRFIYNQGKLFYDVNGSLAGNQIQIASLTGAPVIAASDIIIF